MRDEDVMSKLATLADLHNHGVLSNTEFETLKAELLGVPRRHFLRQDGTIVERRLPALAVVGALTIALALTIGLLGTVSATPNSKSAANNTVHLSLASESSHERSAVGWAASLLGLSKYDGLCLTFAVYAWEYGADFPIRSHITVSMGDNTYPSEVWGHFKGGVVGHSTTPPAGALIFWDSTGGGNPKKAIEESHVAISTGEGNLISSGTYDNSKIHRSTIAHFALNSWNIYKGWWLPDGTNSSTPTKPKPSLGSGGGGSNTPGAGGGNTPTPGAGGGNTPTPGAGGGNTPTPGAGGGNTPTPGAGGGNTPTPGAGGGNTPTPGAGGGNTPTPGAGGGNTPTPGAGGGNTPTPGAGGGNTLTPGAGGGNTPTPGAGGGNTPTPGAGGGNTLGQQTPPPATTYPETVGGDAHTWTNYTNAGGNEGPTIPANHTVAIACKITGFRVQDGDTWWYRIAQSPWDNHYYVSADAFYNDGATSGSLHGTPFVDPAVPNC